ncbi:MerR family transcriptional regulator [Tuanshanicoccus lijuaniae]|uniref:MerR family transcriptional regulator n=1 Tax=Aerococcaceae bacterium zg-1292 TaxID=2774330 RepID=UPI001936BF16|nr:MerR family transcriptional regulator [Aerococcaceae bacterium zg-1292]MBF6625414.1 MerR family transcriptional regulator [Aerococcaceae bacterium zg-BR9]MBF6979075.1 MerR family transcriptional regulator [Aerococcaceae bacterium zg-BR22]MBS4456354.1 MerR family transcriptional regulator [Aerococcaceae bacterium zg-A91]MBS4458230.1 MerR family transcriptional regulator [Aerococcaceae bacterium zg-BR33]
MAHKEIKKSLPIFPIGTVMRLTGLTARQIRYYEDYHLISPERTNTNRRLYSLNDIDRLLEVMDMIDDGMTLKGIQKHYQKKADNVNSMNNHTLTDQDVRRILQDELDIRMRF